MHLKLNRLDSIKPKTVMNKINHQPPNKHRLGCYRVTGLNSKYEHEAMSMHGGIDATLWHISCQSTTNW